MRKLSGESWLGLVRQSTSKKSPTVKDNLTIGVLTFEVSTHMSKALHLWHSLTRDPISRLRADALRLQGVRKLVSDDDNFLLWLALSETIDSVHSLVLSVSRLGQRCSDPLLQRFDHLFADLVLNGSDPYGLLCSGKKMERKVKRLEGFAAAGADLYQEIGILEELEMNQGKCSLDFKQKVVLQRQAVKGLREASVWNRSYDYTTRLLARSLFTIVERLKLVFRFQQMNADDFSKTVIKLSRSNSVNGGVLNMSASGPIKRSGQIDMSNGVARDASAPRRGNLLRSHAGIRWLASSKSFKGCMVGGGNSSPVLDGDEIEGDEYELPANILDTSFPAAIFRSGRKLLNAPPSTLGSAALALHYANVVIVIEKLAASPHLIGDDARDDLYGMLPVSIRMALRIRLKSYAKNLSSSVYDPDLAADWTDAIDKILEWLSPLAHNMIRWHSDRNFERHHLVSSTNVLLLQTLYYANQGKTEAAITELLVGLNYLWRYAKELNEKAILECATS